MFTVELAYCCGYCALTTNTTVKLPLRWEKHGKNAVVSVHWLRMTWSSNSFYGKKYGKYVDFLLGNAYNALLGSRNTGLVDL